MQEIFENICKRNEDEEMETLDHKNDIPNSKRPQFIFHHRSKKKEQKIITVPCLYQILTIRNYNLIPNSHINRNKSQLIQQVLSESLQAKDNNNAVIIFFVIRFEKETGHNKTKIMT